MFVSAIEEIQKFSRPIHSIIKYYHNPEIIPGAATYFFVNEQNDAITCRHVAQNLLIADELIQKYTDFKAEKKTIGTKVDGKSKKALLALETKYGYNNPEAVAILKNQLVYSTELHGTNVILHPTLDLAIIRFPKNTSQNYTSCARFIRDSTQIKPGKFLCRYGYPFVEFKNYAYDPIADNLDFTNEPVSTPAFPIEGMVTRLAAPNGQQITEIELSTPGIRGQSGGPLFDNKGIVYGLQATTLSYHLGFDEQRLPIISKGKKIHVVNHSFLNVGRCIHVEVIKDFLRANEIPFYEE